MKRTKKYTIAAKQVDANKVYTIAEAAELLPKISTSKFAGSVEVSLMLNLTEKQKKETVRGTYSLPHQFGSQVRVLAFVDPQNMKSAEKADIAGGEELIKEVEAGKLEFDAVIATPLMMAKIARLGKVLGSKGLMPNPKNGTVTTDPAKTIQNLKSGMRNFKMLEGGVINGIVAKTDMTTAQITENLNAFFSAVLAEVKKFGSNPFKKVMVKPSMGPVLTVQVSVTEN